MNQEEVIFKFMQSIAKSVLGENKEKIEALQNFIIDKSVELELNPIELIVALEVTTHALQKHVIDLAEKRIKPETHD